MRHGEPSPEERHLFHGRHAKAFFAAVLCTAPVLLLLLHYMEPTLRRSWLLLGLGTASYYAWIHTSSRNARSRLPKEISVGIGFALTIFLPEVLTGQWLAFLPQAICFAALCWFNCTLIYEREHRSLHHAHWSTLLAIRNATALQAALLLYSISLCFIGNAPRSVSFCIALSAALMMALRHTRHRTQRLNYRIAADAALLTPLIFLFR
jgi:hypothetical protein